MGTLFISLLTLVLILISVFVVLVVLMQRTSQSGGMGAALGGGAAESAFGADTSNVLTKGTIYGTIAYFVIALGLYLIYQSQARGPLQEIDAATLITTDQSVDTAETSTLVVDPESIVGLTEGIEGTIKAEVESSEINVLDEVAPVVEGVLDEVAPVVDGVLNDVDGLLKEVAPVVEELTEEVNLPISN